MAQWDIFARGQTPKLYTKGQMIYLQGEQPHHFYYLVSGSARSFLSSPEGDERILTIHRSGDLMGEASFFDQYPRVSSAMALEDSLVVVFSLVSDVQQPLSVLDGFAVVRPVEMEKHQPTQRLRVVRVVCQHFLLFMQGTRKLLLCRQPEWQDGKQEETDCA